MRASLIRLARSALVALWVVGVSAGCPRFGESSPARDFSSDGRWTTYNPFSITDGRYSIAFYDSVEDRVVRFDGRETYALDLSGEPAWVTLPATPGVPGPHGDQAWAFDEAGRRCFVIGGELAEGGATRVWQLSLTGPPAWSLIEPSGPAPPPLVAASAAFDPVRRRVIVFGGAVGLSGFRTHDVWVLDLDPTPRWTPLLPAGNLPPARSQHETIYDPVRDRVVIFGGLSDVPPGTLNDAWVLSLSGVPTWSRLLPSGTPPSRATGSAIYDPDHDRMILVLSAYDPALAETWSLSLGEGGAWQRLAFTTTEPFGTYDAGAFDSRRRRMIAIEGGRTPTHVWALALAEPSTWSELDPWGARLPVLADLGAVIDAAQDRMLVFGGIDATSRIASDVWELALRDPRGWRHVLADGVPPDPTFAASVIFDPAGRRLVVFGGDRGTSTTNEVWALELEPHPHWTHPTISGASPSARRYAVAAYDSASRRMIVFGGQAPNNDEPLGDLWTLSLDGSWTWTPLGVAGPTPRWSSSLAYDPPRNRFVMLGGASSSGSISDELWSLVLQPSPVWTLLGHVMSRAQHTLVHDPLRDRFILFGGGTTEPWEIAFAPTLSVRRLAPLHPLTIDQSRHAAVFDARGNTMIVTGGSTFAAPPHHVLGLSFASPATPEAMCPATISATPGTIATVGYTIRNPDIESLAVNFTVASSGGWADLPVSGRVVAGGLRTTFVPVRIPVPGSGSPPSRLAFTLLAADDHAVLDSCAHTVEGLADLLGAPGAVLVLHSVRPNPARGSFEISFTRSPGAPVRIEAFDVLGRLRISGESIIAGRQSARVDVSAWPAGLYWVRVTQGTERKAARICVVR